MDPESAVTLGMELKLLMPNCTTLKSLDLFLFYYWVALQPEPDVSANLSSFNLLKLSAECFRAQDHVGTLRSCLPFVFLIQDTWIELGTLARNCSEFFIWSKPLHLELSEAIRQRYSLERMPRLLAKVSNMPLLEDLVLDISHNVADSGPTLEFLSSQCENLRSLKLGQFHGIFKGPELDGDGVAFSLSRTVLI